MFFLICFLLEVFLISQYFIEWNLCIVLEYMLSNVKENTYKSHFKTSSGCHLKYSLYGLSLLVSLYFFSVLPFGRNKKSSQRRISPLCWCVVHKSREVVNLPLKRNFYFLGDAFSKLFLTIIMLKCLIHSSTIKKNSVRLSDLQIFCLWSELNSPISPESLHFWAFTSQVPLTSWNGNEPQVVFRESYHDPSYIPMNVRFPDWCQGRAVLGWG